VDINSFQEFLHLMVDIDLVFRCFFFLNKKGVEPAILDRQNFYRVYIKVGLVSPKMLPIIGNQHI
jgi:hypothetical protein